MIKGTPSNDSIEAILTRLGSEPAFREKMLGDPKAAFAEHGVEIDESKVPAVRWLPSMDDIKRNRDEYKTRQCGELGFSRFFLR
jgi:putative modified peptide